jgi:hypothetical protein
MASKFIYLRNNIRHQLTGSTIEVASKHFHLLPQETQNKLQEEGQLYKVTPKGAWITARILSQEELAQKKVPKKKPDIAYFDAKASVDTIEWYGIASSLRVKSLQMSRQDVVRCDKAKEALKAAVVEYLEKNITKILTPFME